MENELNALFVKKYKTTTYQAAQMVAPIIEAHFTDNQAVIKDNTDRGLVSHPTAEIIEVIIDTVFWASLRTEEGNSPKISLALLPPEQAGKPLLFEYRMLLTADSLTKIAPGVERPGIHLGVWYDADELYIWGTTHNIPDYCLVVDVSEPGLLIIKHRRMIGFGKFVNIAVLKGDQIKVIDQDSAHLPDCPTLLSSLLGIRTLGSNSVNVLIQLAVSMRAHGQGGLLLVVPAGSENWQESILQPMKYSVLPAFAGLKDLIKQNDSEKDNNPWQNALSREISSIAGLTAVDGATIITDQYELLAFGTKIIRPLASEMIKQILTTEPVRGAESVIVNPSMNGGTRHFSAAQFVHNQHDSLALVASQDGHFTVFTWSPCENMVHAHRIDSLLL